MAQLERIYWLYRQLKEDAYPGSAAFRQRFIATDKTMKRDLAVLRDIFGARIIYNRRHKGYQLTDRNFELPSFWFKREQLLLLNWLCRQLGRITGGNGGAAELTARITGLLSLQNGPQAENIFSFEFIEIKQVSQVIDALVEALLARRTVRFTYRSLGDAGDSSREVEPYRLHNCMGNWYLVGYCLLRKAPRIFQINRIHDLSLGTRPFIKERFDVEIFLGEPFGIFKGKAANRVRLLFDSFAAAIIREEFWHPNQNIEETPDGLILTLPVANFTEIKMKVLKYGRHVKVLEPQELQDMIVEEARLIQKRYK
ncbi:MAG: WYL domain-containing protein [Proteobacteria bacterium]|nr:WYL domain-containing protein [Pseudomonadota bacterium]MBU1687685.1 WYL domain-containing protein [Pseudomonadota bacterium]